MKTIYDSRNPASFAYADEDFAKPEMTFEDWFNYVTPISSFDKEFCQKLHGIVGDCSEEHKPGNYFFVLTRTSNKRVVLDLFEATVERAGWCEETGSKIWDPVIEKVFTMIAPRTSEAMIAAIDSVVNPEEKEFTQAVERDGSTPW